jgi:hypothetical protein
LLEDDVYLQMQALNLGVVDHLLNDMEDQLFAEYIEEEHTPAATFVPVAALSQLWVFGVYELLRTWRQRASHVLTFADQLRGLPRAERKRWIAQQVAKVEAAAGNPDQPDPVHARWYQRAARSSRFRDRLRAALDRSEWPFRRLEALRVFLAKHEVPRSKGLSFASAPGFGGVDSVSRSVFWQVDLGRMEVDSLSRRRIAEMCRELGSRRRLPLLPVGVQQRIATFPQHSYGIKRVILRLRNGAECAAYVAWNKQVAWVPGQEGADFDAAQVVDAQPMPSESA